MPTVSGVIVMDAFLLGITSLISSYVFAKLQRKLDHLKTFGGFFKKWANAGLFFIYFWSFQTNNTIFTTNICENMSIQFTVPGFEHTTFRT